MSWTIFSVSRTFARSVPRNANSSTASSRSWIRSSAVSGRSSRAKQAPAHRCDRPVDLVQQRSAPAALDGFDHLEVAEGGRIDDEAICAGAKRDVPDVREIDFLCVPQVLNERARGPGRRRMILEPKASKTL
jgi:hypothetical protein